MAVKKTKKPLSFQRLRKINVERCNTVFAGLDSWSETDWATALGGECGEALNLIKKRRRGDPSIGTKLVAHELADIIIYADLLAAKLGINLGQAVAKKFNITSKQKGSPLRL
jgi:NTP pyrophosphatase (non-canonical NTP hydrolase)